ncbi:hypothetical protein AMS68_007665 [Peltaster fructicola]|uniref:Pyrroloquinoline quinone-dependent pyranose dehydrogenase beta-propeller domain-containing protein n=1 Tax=Peltaster fructicola TaxID=286661 RepID=A0A6H0Y5N3_9PEZI|nr:hypothetical protein AMS68_007665 [Peltaster fructicola]
MAPIKAIVLALLAITPVAFSQSSYGGSSCSATLTASYAAPSVASGYTAMLVAQNLTKPRGIKFDSAGNLLVVEQNVGISVLTPNSGDCPGFSSRKRIITDSTLNHGIEVKHNSSGDWLLASSTEAVYLWNYSPSSQSNTSAPQTIVSNMTGTDHTTRTLLLTQKAEGFLVVTRGSLENLDATAADESTGVSQVKAFEISDTISSPYKYDTDGILLGWGLRNEVGVDEDPVTGNIYGVENSADQITRDGQDIHENNPGEELNFLGNLNNDSVTVSGDRNYGYPSCLAAWSPGDIPNFNGSVGTQFAIDFPNGTNATDASCAQHTAPRLTFQAHMAPLDILFNPSGTAAWITFHGSWNRDVPSGYKLSVVKFANGEPTEPSTTTTSLLDIVTNQNNSACPNGCFRPVGLAWDSQGRLFMSSDSTGEIYAIYPSDGSPASTVGSNSSTSLPNATTPATSSSPTSSTSPSASSTTSAATSSVATSTAAEVLPCEEEPPAYTIPLQAAIHHLPKPSRHPIIHNDRD